VSGNCMNSNGTPRSRIKFEEKEKRRKRKNHAREDKTTGKRGRKTCKL
jgi:hypothetical protein